MGPVTQKTIDAVVKDLLKEYNYIVVTGKPYGRRNEVIKNIITTFRKDFNLIVLDWYGLYDNLNLNTLPPNLPYTKASPYLHLVASSMLDLNSLKPHVEATVFEATASSRSLKEVLATLAAARDKGAKLAYQKLSHLLPYIEDDETPLQLKNTRVNLALAKPLHRIPLLQLWIAYTSEVLDTNQNLLIIDEAGHALRRCWWIWLILDDLQANGTRLVLVDQKIRRDYLRHALIFSDSDLEELYTAFRYRIPEIIKKKGSCDVIAIAGNRITLIKRI